MLDQLRALQVVLIRMGPPDLEQHEKTLLVLDAAYPSPSRRINHELVELLVYLKAPGIIDRTLALLEKSEDSRDWSQYLVFLGYVEDGWTTDQRKRYLQALQRFEKTPGGRYYVQTAVNLRKKTIAALSGDQKAELAGLLEPGKPEIPAPVVTLDPAKFVKVWTMEDFAEALKKPLADRSLKSGEAAFTAAACIACHTMSGNASSAASILGPDLSGVGARFGTADLLESIIHPSRVIDEKYRNPAGPNISTMPPGLINVLEKEKVLDLLAYLQAGGTEKK
jgi:mono/diheme cytochrome c family protein